ncbi:MAG: response regulator [Gammaproteobacteria bacterium]|nr:response regulator [Gammaproteobacteria bacterium]MBQ0775376.1 response regulator [Gammaproteobacteria bacterium]|tara:strand:+ start:46003 stop:46695 length:693 start_codon:yes stop_codon:yes gene_type:complete
MTRVLIVEDERAIAELLADYCHHNNFIPEICINETDILNTINQMHTDIVLLDLMLPGINGLDLCQKIRKISPIPILIISARIDEVDRLLGLELGADDYICKPFSPREVMARIKATLRRQSSLSEKPKAEFTLEKSRLQVSWQGTSMALTAVEFSLLEALADHAGHILSRQQLMDRGYEDHRVVSDRTIDSHIKKLRHKLSDAFPATRFIESVYGAGYRLDIQPANCAVDE